MRRSFDGADEHQSVRRVYGRSLAGVVAILLTVMTLAFAGQADLALADATDSDDSGLLSVVVTDDSTPAPTPSPTRSSTSAPSQSPARPSSGGGGTAPTATGTATVATIADPGAADGALVDAEVIDGVLAISGLTANALPWLDVGNGSLTVDFVIRNLSSTAFDSTAQFWVDNAFGARIAEIGGVAVSGLQPGETRRVQVRFTGLGQQVVLHAHATLTPPKVLDGVELGPISRNSSLLVPPWFSIVLATGISLIGWATWQLLRRRTGVIALPPPAAGLAQ